MDKFRLLFLMLLLLSFLVSCSGMPDFTIEQVVLRGIRGWDTDELQFVPGSIHTTQKQSLGQLVMVLSRYQSKDKDGMVWDCLHLTSVFRKKFVWMEGETGGGGCSRNGEQFGPISIRNIEGSGWDAVMGVIYQPEITAVNIFWDNDEIQPAQVSDHTYLAVSSGVRQSMVKIQCLDQEGKILYELSH